MLLAKKIAGVGQKILAIIVIFLILVFALGNRSRAPLKVLAIVWFICVAPLATGIVSYTYLSYSDPSLPLTLIGFLTCFTSGVLLSDLNSLPNQPVPDQVASVLIRKEFLRTRPLARLCWWVAVIGTACISIDFFSLQGAGLNDIAALRDAYVGKTEATFFARLGSVLTWACPYCFAYALTYRQHMSRLAVLTYLMPIGGYFLILLFSAGRQAAFQIMIITLLILWINRIRQSKGARRSTSRSGTIIALVISILMVAYMGFIAVVRNDGNLSDDKAEVLTTLFDLKVNTQFNNLLMVFGTGIRSTVTEAVVYFSSSIAIFSKFLSISIPDNSFGAMSFPFVFRQLQPLTGIDVIGAYTLKVDLMSSAGVIGVGWQTAVSAYIQDFGIIGACMFLFLQGYYTAYSWRRAINGFGFNEAIIAVILLTSVAYMPLIAASSDTNLFLLWIFCVLTTQRGAFRTPLRRKAETTLHGVTVKKRLQ